MTDPKSRVPCAEGWIFDALQAVCDGLVWADLGAMMPAAGGSYRFLREMFPGEVGRFLAFLFVFQLMVQHHDPSFGDNSPAGYIEEDSVQALEQIVSERVGFGQNVCRYWEEQDGGMHVLAAAIYWEYKSALDAGPQPYSAWFTKAVADGNLRGEPLKAAVRQVLPAGKCPQAIEH